MKPLDLPALTEVLDDIDCFERERTDRGAVQLALVLYDAGLSLRKTQRVLGWLGVERSHVAIWKWIQTFGRRLLAANRQPVETLPSTVLVDETAIFQRGRQFTLFAAVTPTTREVVHLDVAPTRNYLTTRRFFEGIRAIYGQLPAVVITDAAREYGPVFEELDIERRVISHGVRNRVERWIQELKRRIDTFYASFTGASTTPTQRWLRQFAWFWNACLS